MQTSRCSGFPCCGAWFPGLTGFSSCCSRAQQLWPTGLVALRQLRDQGSLPGPGIKPMYLALAGGFFTTEPPGNPVLLFLFWVFLFFFFFVFWAMSAVGQFDILIMCLGGGLFGYILFGTQCFLDLVVWLLCQIREAFSHYLFKQVFCPFHFLVLGPLLCDCSSP